MRPLFNRIAFRFSGLKRTALYDWHVANKGKIVEFAGNSYYIQDTSSPCSFRKESSSSTSIRATSVLCLM